MKKNILFFLVLLSQMSLGQGLIAKFSVNSESITPKKSKFKFINNSSGNFTSVFWEFPDGNPSTSTDNNPIVSYTKTGYHLATLKITNSSSSSTKTIFFTIKEGEVMIDLTSGRKEDGTLCEIGELEPNWKYRNLFSNTESIVPARVSEQYNWSLPSRSDLIDTHKARYMSNRNTGMASLNTFQHEFIRTFNLSEDGVLNFRALGKNQVKVFLDEKVIAETYVAIPNYTYQGFFNSWSTDPRDTITNEVIYNIPISKGLHVIKGWVRNEAGSTGFVLNGSVKKKYSIISPEAEFKIENSETCVGIPIQFKSTSQGSPVSYSWKFYNEKDTILSSEAQPSIIFKQSGKYNVFLEVKYANNSYSSLLIDKYINIDNCNDIYAPNSYIFDINNANNVGLYIPIKKAYDMWKYGPYMKGISINGIPSASIYWEDVSGLIKSVQLKPESAEIEVLIDKLRGKGNAVIALHSGPKGNNEDPVYWSWHVWVTDDPTKGVEYGHPKYPERDIDGNIFTPKFMDRNLGATSKNFLGNEWNKSGGLYYQWGRKDPFPPLVYKDQTHYNVTGTIGSTNSGLFYQEQQGVTPRPYSDINQNIPYSVQHPFKLINPPTGQHWFSEQILESSDTAFNLWSDNYEGKIGGDWSNTNSTYKLKSPFDPCPEGWRVPSYRGGESGASVVSPWGGQSGEEPGGYKGTFIDTNANTAIKYEGRYANVIFYPALGINFKTPFSNSNVSLLGNYPLTGKIWKYDNYNTLIAQDQFSETFTWGATSSKWFARQLHLQSLAELAFRNKNIPERWYIGPHSGASTYQGNTIRCIQDPNHSKLNNYATKYITAKEFNYTKGLDNPNSYIIKNSATQIKIPVSKAYSVYNQYLTDHGWPSGNQLFASAVWSTVPAIVKSVYVEGADENANIVVNLIENVRGNAVVALHIGNNKNATDPIYWSWHIWVPNGDPEQNTITYTTEDIKPTGNHVINLTNTGLPPLTTTFMDRDLGAEYAFPKELIDNPSSFRSYKEIIKNSGGLHFQWGRKDPIPLFFYVGYSGVEKLLLIGQTAANGNVSYPTFLNSDEKYMARYVSNYPNYTQIAGVKSTNKEHENVQQILKYSINNPLTFLANTTGSKDWLTDRKNIYSERWGHGTKKSVFDPCPAGWRVPDNTFAFSSFDSLMAKGTSPWYNGRGRDYDNSLGIIQHGVKKNGKTISGNRDIIKYYKGTELNTGWTAGWIFKNSEYPIGAYPLNLIRRSGKLDAFRSRTSGLWSATMDQGGNGLATIFAEKIMNVGNADFPLESAMSIRCAKDEPRYTGATPPPNSWNLISSASKAMNVKKDILEQDLQIYPNPTSGLFTIELNDIQEGSMQIININGQVIYSKPFKNQTEWNIDIANQPAGIYIIKIQFKQQIITKKIIKQ
ncbi:T9SS type A sorting domain-containing protein [Apibacter adventoris]|uniref:T9SS type A sorting domain-containing protein n=1 Tax=Apibacter adventoris TaxID=1679466 RepID=UPI000CF73ADB|nr:T9SS type A sorting domain-containing protein [Apibacter adventoris]PQL93835.1 hypothetical protein C4S76_07045 [Apibacter adventoris]